MAAQASGTAVDGSGGTAGGMRETRMGETRREMRRGDGEGGGPNESRRDDDVRPRTMHGGEKALSVQTRGPVVRKKKLT